jgi:hypothetical protein
MGFIPVSEVLMLIALAGGYIVFYLAKREEAVPRLVGYCIAAIIITTSILYMITSSWMQSRVYDSKMQYYHMMKMKDCGKMMGASKAMPKMSPMMKK